jgi:geranylgeranyl diphosphate synthase type II
MAAIEALGGDSLPFMPAACAVELVHTYSLIHDDLPAMDDDDLRRGKLTNHKVYGEATAILAGDALLTLAFELIADMGSAPAPLRLDVIKCLAECSGAAGMVGGQALDLASEGKRVSEDALEQIHAHKTAALIRAAVIAGGILGGADEKDVRALSDYGRSLGMAFQITDDILDATGDEARTGKRVRKDEKARKATYPSVYGVEGAEKIARRYVDAALEALSIFDAKAEPLMEIARILLSRER